MKKPAKNKRAFSKAGGGFLNIVPAEIVDNVLIGCLHR